MRQEGKEGREGGKKRKEEWERGGLEGFGDAMLSVSNLMLSPPGSPDSGDVRLAGHTSDYIGAVEYYDSLRDWTGICADSAHSSSWNSNTAAARIVCRQLGYEGGRPYSQRYRATYIVHTNI